MLYKSHLIAILFFCFVGCSTTEDFFDDITSPDYVNSSKAKRLEVPPDLSEMESNTDYNVPGDAKSYRKFMDREEQLAENNQNKDTRKVIANPEGMKIVKSGNLRWLVVNEEPDLIWPHVIDFWENLGFRIMISNKRTGIIETEWMDTDDIKLDRKKGTLSSFDKWLDSLSGFADKRKFRTRIEYGENSKTEIYISQRSAEAAADQHSRILKERDSGYNPSTLYKIEEYKSEGADGKPKLEISEQRAIDDYEIDSELLTRLMIKLGATDLYAQKSIENPQILVKSELISTENDIYILMKDPYDRSWRRLGLALDIIGFITEDKNRTDGIYYVRYNALDIPKEEKDNDNSGLIDYLAFWKDSKKDNDNKSEVNEEKSEKSNEINEENQSSDNYTGVESPQVKPIDEDYDSKKDWKPGEEETWLTSLWPSSDEEENYLHEDEKRYRIRIKPGDNNSTIVYIDYSDGKRNNSNDARKILKVINDYLK